MRKICGHSHSAKFITWLIFTKPTWIIRNHFIGSNGIKKSVIFRWNFVQSKNDEDFSESNTWQIMRPVTLKHLTAIANFSTWRKLLYDTKCSQRPFEKPKNQLARSKLSFIFMPVVFGAVCNEISVWNIRFLSFRMRFRFLHWFVWMTQIF